MDKHLLRRGMRREASSPVPTQPPNDTSPTSTVITIGPNDAQATSAIPASSTQPSPTFSDNRDAVLDHGNKISFWGTLSNRMIGLLMLVTLLSVFFLLRYFHFTEQFSGFPIPSGSSDGPLRHPSVQAPIIQTKQDRQRAEHIRDAVRHAWKGYTTVAFGADEVLPVTNVSHSHWGGYGVSLIDALDTLWFLGFKEEFHQALGHVHRLDFSQFGTPRLSFFETVIRTIGGLLSTYEITNDRTVLQKALQMADILEPAMNNSLGFPYHDVNPVTGEGTNPSWNGERFILSEVATFQLEYAKLSRHSGNPKYHDAAQAVMNTLYTQKPPIPGLYPISIDMTGAYAKDAVSFGANGDSFYEYLLKRYILTDRTEPMFKDMYIEAIEAMTKHLIHPVIYHEDMVYVGELGPMNDEQTSFHTLACFVPGMLALGSKVLNRPDDLLLAEKMVNACVHVAKSSKSGLAYDAVRFGTYDDYRSNLDVFPERAETLKTRGFVATSVEHILRPEIVESLFILYRITGNRRYQEHGWEIFQSLEKYAKTPVAYSALRNVDSIEDISGNWSNSMESFFLAETMKYLYLLFADPKLISLDHYVFNTEAHPLKIMHSSH
ncbi:hypothetical protein H4R34_004811 [Dimargaris verticillata]|uniref:alpha-1,2-Mannosidase n=1 Tax=Dimargaris verticillata TaxID=2761393 RepID=A0A9W8E6U0_9FUNG|nr:hypothetical protein H4R34_004811 [Dimargaris verticillata]